MTGISEQARAEAERRTDRKLETVESILKAAQSQIEDAMREVANVRAASLNPEPSTDVREGVARLIGDSEAYGQSAWHADYEDSSWEFMRDWDRHAADAILAKYHLTPKQAPGEIQEDDR